MKQTVPACILLLLGCALGYAILGGQQGCGTCTDEDADGFAVEGGTCGPVDCDDTDPLVNPGAAEVCEDAVDNDCDGLTDGADPDCPECWDDDGDNYDDEVCGGTDCDDTDPEVYPDAEETCDGIDEDCDGAIDEDVLCELPNATAYCAGAGGCRIDSCDHGWADCDPDPFNGCEVRLDDNYGSCGAADYLGSVAGDENCDFLCPECYEVGPTSQDRGEGWYEIYVEETSNCCADVAFHARLFVPAGADYDLFLWAPCGNLIDSSQNGQGQTEQVDAYLEDDCFGESQSTWFYIEIRYYDGDSCLDWTLETRGGRTW